MDTLELTGRSRTHIVQIEEPRCALHREVVAPFLALREAGARAGLDIAPMSAFRDFEAQVEIWNRKFRGERPLYDRDGNLREHATLTEEELIDAILVWSAVPGASRHHWGTDIDVYDRAAVPAGYRVQLLPEEYAVRGVFERLAQWLDENLERFGFFRPYDVERGGVFPEPWHISFAPVATPALAAVTPGLIGDALRGSDVLGKGRVLDRLVAIHRRYVANVAGTPASALGLDGSA